MSCYVAFGKAVENLPLLSFGVRTDDRLEQVAVLVGVAEHRGTPRDILMWVLCLWGVVLTRGWAEASGIRLVSQLYIAERVVGSIPIMDETTEGAALVVHVVLYICFVSVAIDTLNAWTRGLLHNNTPTLPLLPLGARRLGCAQ